MGKKAALHVKGRTNEAGESIVNPTITISGAGEGEEKRAVIAGTFRSEGGVYDEVDTVRMQAIYRVGHEKEETAPITWTGDAGLYEGENTITCTDESGVMQEEDITLKVIDDRPVPQAGRAVEAEHAVVADSAKEAEHAAAADSAKEADHAAAANTAANATNATNANNAASLGGKPAAQYALTSKGYWTPTCPNGSINFTSSFNQITRSGRLIMAGTRMQITEILSPTALVQVSGFPDAANGIYPTCFSTLPPISNGIHTIIGYMANGILSLYGLNSNGVQVPIRGRDISLGRLELHAIYAAT